jgi:HSP20 family molecular chaperone IbpA
MAVSRQYSVARRLVWLDDSIKLWVDMPGVKGSDVEVTHKDGVLTITGTVSTKAYEKLAPVYTEYNVETTLDGSN